MSSPTSSDAETSITHSESDSMGNEKEDNWERAAIRQIKRYYAIHYPEFKKGSRLWLDGVVVREQEDEEYTWTAEIIAKMIRAKEGYIVQEEGGKTRKEALEKLLDSVTRGWDDAVKKNAELQKQYDTEYP
ncbi:hypothetical protein P280DRAFT_484177 [Massarina eburnea CBS 473.64]|uniref:Uncharacterized protein n=1 Tax=Massarina eburnea CBS 473.64 TaxID=1395130 RepID=A0A6A6RLL8_9PLEO|nr:hypothetical protein P280DRAFT_484177 [Massarina eburnea CBS 473.64]